MLKTDLLYPLLYRAAPKCSAPPPPPPPSSAAAAAAKTRRAEDQLLKAAIDESLQKPVDPRKQQGTHRHHSLACPAPDCKYGSCLALHIVATTRRAARPLSQRPSSTSAPSPWKRRPHPSQRYVLYAFTVHVSQLPRLYRCRRASPAHRRRRRRQDVSRAPPNAVDRLLSA